MITLTEEQAQQIEEALVNLCNSIQLPTSDVKALATIRAARTQEFTAEQQDRFATAFDEAFAKAGLPQKQAEQEPVARVAGYYGGRYVIEPLNRATILPTDMALYAAPVQQAEQEPVHVENIYKRGNKYFAWIGDDYVQIYTAPVRTKDLTDSELEKTYDEICRNASSSERLLFRFARAVIAADREKNK